MNNYHPQINAAAYSREWLRTRHDELARIGRGGSPSEKKSVHRRAELAAIEAALAGAPRPMRRVGIVDTPMVPARPAAARGYSADLQAVARDFNPTKYDRYL